MLMAQLVSYKRDSDQQRNLHVASQESGADLIA